MNGILLAVLLIAGIGLIAGVGLSVASVLMAVPKDERAEEILEKLPGANCGACGYSGCSGYAAALAKGEAENGLCSLGGAAAAKEIAALLGQEVKEVQRKTALVHCIGTYDNTTDKMEYLGVDSCAAANQLFGGVGSCLYGCMGIGDCVASCEYGAITLCNGVAHIDPTLCKGCSKCVKACPKGLITFEPLKPIAVVRCKNCDKGNLTNKVCKVGCIGCMKCAKACATGAITIENFVASVNPDKCTGCGACVEACPRGCVSLLSATVEF